MLATSTTCWVLTDGKAGDEVQCLGVAEALGLTPQSGASRRARLGLADAVGADRSARGPGPSPGGPSRRPSRTSPSPPAAAPCPTCAHVKRASGGRTFTVFLKDPRTGAGAADFIWVPQHDRLRGPNVLATLTSPHRVSPERLADAAALRPGEIAGLPHPRAALLVGRRQPAPRFTQAISCASSLSGERWPARAQPDGHGVPPLARRAWSAACAKSCTQKRRVLVGWGREQPYMSRMLAAADAIVVTADSVNMVGEACATGRPVLVFDLKRAIRAGPARSRPS